MWFTGLWKLINNNLFYLKRKWDKLMIKKPSAIER